MRIVLATGLYPPEIGGPATYTALLETELNQRGYQIVVVPFSRSRHLPKILRHAHYLYLLLKASKHATVIFAQDVVSVGLPALLAARLRRKKFVVRVPGDYAWEQSTQRFGVTDSIDDFQTKKYGWQVEMLRRVQRWVVISAHYVITPSDYFTQLVTAWGVAESKISTIYNGVDFHIDPVVLPVPAQPTIVSAGRLVSWKGFATLIKVLTHIPEWQLVIIGSGPDEQMLKQIAYEQGVTHRVKFLGQVSRPEVFGWCKVADVFVLNTSFESFSFQVIEAMYAGIPVIATQVGSLPELIDSENEGILIKPNDIPALVHHIRSVKDSPLAWQTRTHNAIRKAEQFSIAKTMDQVCDLLNSF